jgi:hypothetical protein
MPVLTCSCCDFGCGGALMQISFEGERRVVGGETSEPPTARDRKQEATFAFDHKQV